MYPWAFMNDVVPVSATIFMNVHGIIPENRYGINSFACILKTIEYTIPMTSTSPRGDKKDHATPKKEFLYLFLKSCFIKL